MFPPGIQTETLSRTFEFEILRASSSDALRMTSCLCQQTAELSSSLRYTNFLDYSECLINAGANRWSVQVIAREPEAGEARAKVCDRRQAVAVTEIVLREGAGPNGDIGKNGIAFDGEDAGDPVVDERYQILRLQPCRGGVGCSADEAGQLSMTFWSAAGEER